MYYVESVRAGIYSAASTSLEDAASLISSSSFLTTAFFLTDVALGKYKISGYGTASVETSTPTTREPALCNFGR